MASKSESANLSDKSQASIAAEVFPKAKGYGFDVDGSEKRRRFVTTIKAEQWWAEKARNDPTFFIEYLTEQKPANHHRIWLANFFSPQRKRINLIAPRESAKTTISVYGMLWFMSKAPLRTNCIVSVAEKQATDRLMMIYDAISNNPRYRNVFPWIHIDNHRANTQREFTIYSDYEGMPYSAWKSLITRTASPLDKNPTLYATGSGGRGMISRRINGWMLIDDIIDEDTLTDAAQEKTMDYMMRTLIPCVQEEGKVIVIGTRWMIGDVPERLKNNPAYYTSELPAIIRDGEGNQHSYWPEFWPLEKLENKRIETNNDAIFNIMYMCDPQAMVMSYFTIEGMNKDLPDPLPKLTKIYVSTDVAISQKAKADFNVAMAIGLDEDNNAYLLDMVRFKAAVEDIAEQFANFCDKIALSFGRFDGLLSENVAFQAAVYQILMSRRPDIPIIPVTPKGDKGHRASVVSHWQKQGKLYINQNMPDIKQLKSEWLNFDLHPHDDTLDPVGLLFQYLGMATGFARLKRIKPEGKMKGMLL